jgi:uncharacterized protein YyaL (SSP411 family)
MNRLADALSPYLRAHADNPVDWFPWGEDAFDEARRRDVPVLISIGYATCHWCHVMARESFSDPELADHLNERFVAVKVDREEHPDVDAAYLAAASAFTPNLGWPLTVATTPDGRTFFAGTYFPPRPMGGHPSFREVLDAVDAAWRERRTEVEQSAAGLAEALSVPVGETAGDAALAVEGVDLSAVARSIVAGEDREYGGFGGAPKFPVTPALLASLALGRSAAVDDEAAREVGAFARRTLATLAASGLRDPVEGGFFRYATRRDWTEPHYERMLYDNAQLLRAYGDAGDEDTAAGIVRFLTSVLRRPEGGFGSAQDSESVLDGVRNEGGYYRLPAEARAQVAAPAVDAKVLTGWNGLAIGALAHAARRLDRPDWLEPARVAAEAILAPEEQEGRLLRASLDGRPSPARATLEDYGMLARGLLDLALASGEVRWATAARRLVDETLAAAEDLPGVVFAVPGGPDETLARRGLALPADPGEGAYPSGLSQSASAALLLFELTGDRRYRDAAEGALAPYADLAATRPVSMAGTLAGIAALRSPGTALVLVGPVDEELAAVARGADIDVTMVLTDSQAHAWAEAGFELLADRTSRGGGATAYLCEGFVCRLPVTEPAALRELLTALPES